MHNPSDVGPLGVWAATFRSRSPCVPLSSPNWKNKAQETMKRNLPFTTRQSSIACAVSKTKVLSLILTALRRWIVRSAACFLLPLLMGAAHSQPLDIIVSSAQYTTYVQGQGWPVETYPPTSRTTISSFPISDELEFPIEYSPGVTNHAIAGAGLFEVWAQVGWGVANASATSQLRFSPLVDQIQTIGIQISAPLLHGFSSGSVILLDVTSNSELWNYSFSYFSSGNIPWDSGSRYSGTATFELATEFLASDQYELTMVAGGNAGDDTAIDHIQLTGLQVIPELSSVRLLLMALLGFGAWHRQRPTSDSSGSTATCRRV
jgi:hypothetical protein